MLQSPLCQDVAHDSHAKEYEKYVLEILYYNNKKKIMQIYIYIYIYIYEKTKVLIYAHLIIIIIIIRDKITNHMQFYKNK